MTQKHRLICDNCKQKEYHDLIKKKKELARREIDLQIKQDNEIT